MILKFTLCSYCLIPGHRRSYCKKIGQYPCKTCNSVKHTSMIHGCYWKKPYQGARINSYLREQGRPSINHTHKHWQNNSPFQRGVDATTPYNATSDVNNVNTQNKLSLNLVDNQGVDSCVFPILKIFILDGRFNLNILDDPKPLKIRRKKLTF